VDPDLCLAYPPRLRRAPLNKGGYAPVGAMRAIALWERLQPRLPDRAVAAEAAPTVQSQAKLEAPISFSFPGARPAT